MNSKELLRDTVNKQFKIFLESLYGANTNKHICINVYVVLYVMYLKNMSDSYDYAKIFINVWLPVSILASL